MSRRSRSFFSELVNATTKRFYMMVNFPLSRGLGNITKVYLITCSQSTCAKLKKCEFCPVGHGGIAHWLIQRAFFINLSWYDIKPKYCFLILRFGILYFSQNQLPRKMESRLVITKCAGYIFWQLFL